jgi:ribosomal protein S18 acetylase RimI-like enzyme
MNFREATAADIDTVAALHAAFFEEEGYPIDHARGRDAIAELIANPQLGRIVVMEDGDRLDGYFVLGFGYSLEFHGRDAFLDELYVVPNARGKGSGREALRVAERICAEADVRALHLEVEHGKPNTQRLYASFGYHDHTRHLMTKVLA